MILTVKDQEMWSDAYSKLKGARLPFRIPADDLDIPVASPGAPLTESEREIIEEVVTTALSQLGTSSGEATARKSLLRTRKAFTEARIAELPLNFKSAAKQDESALKTVVSAIKNLNRVNAAIQEDLILALSDTVELSLNRALVKLGATSTLTSALEIFVKGLLGVNSGDVRSAADNVLKAYGKIKGAPVSP